MRRLEQYVSTGGRLLRCGYTTGTCATAAAAAATELLLAGSAPPTVRVPTPAGIEVLVDVEEATSGEDWACCAVRKDAGDDADVTDGVLVYAQVSTVCEAGVAIDGGEGVGRVTKPGLDQPVGAAAINSVPRRMIREAVREVARRCDYTDGLRVVVSIPAGIELAERTFNPRLGIQGGISVLGTSGIVRPMSEDALVLAMQLELRMLRAAGAQDVLVVPGNYGSAFAERELGLSVAHAVTCSNYLGATIDEAARLGFSAMLIVGHVGKLVKVAAGVLNTHSRVADARMETLAAHAALAGAGHEVVRALMEATTTEAALDVLAEADVLEQTMVSIMERTAQVLAHRAGASMRVDAVMFSNARGLLGATFDGVATWTFGQVEIPVDGHLLERGQGA